MKKLRLRTSLSAGLGRLRIAARRHRPTGTGTTATSAVAAMQLDFPQFNRLPFELREMIWRLALPDPGPLLDYLEEHRGRGRRQFPHAHMVTLPLVYACAEARRVAVAAGYRLYRPVFWRGHKSFRGGKLALHRDGFYNAVWYSLDRGDVMDLPWLDIPMFLVGYVAREERVLGRDREGRVVRRCGGSVG
ncbi:hypothetical protein F5Y19DRAFT_492424 [Xylariaceae sp. FL1651]|nr:hypothetical protein F5Y19DRAFT_492424 [Xylariaceae sp. FL1651]